METSLPVEIVVVIVATLKTKTAEKKMVDLS